LIGQCIPLNAANNLQMRRHEVARPEFAAGLERVRCHDPNGTNANCLNVRYCTFVGNSGRLLKPRGRRASQLIRGTRRLRNRADAKDGEMRCHNGHALADCRMTSSNRSRQQSRFAVWIVSELRNGGAALAKLSHAARRIVVKLCALRDPVHLATHHGSLVIGGVATNQHAVITEVYDDGLVTHRVARRGDDTNAPVGR
jgi:hypothetical protein